MRKALPLLLIMVIFPGTIRAIKQYTTGTTHVVSFFSHVPTLRFGYSRTGRIKFEGPTRYREKWTFATGKAIFSSPVIDGRGRIIFGSR
ncbi:hypothetical protein KKF84_01340, partial [Myxococcota bacterium]|nr:hypothetical protein [Myxococcota bacterium]MBU1533928.1 hypothetical protein [Myxococcota bacterium]